ncbi:hypothetical protein NK6_3360 [Bradyrhizobium diazoefficiens]|uniref:Uncharacterized protein n=1 Tax=Bradyrhizobium diazoefficiens TaxID=1355477 RepID=A0A0E4FUT8_9BRAD|nr:hypothetical protein NK6_3360 [Bradyrhizobium diazoefficiens]
MGCGGHDAPSTLAASPLHLSAESDPRSNSRHQSRNRLGVSSCREKAPQPPDRPQAGLGRSE